jgi:hypothetical protein
MAAALVSFAVPVPQAGLHGEPVPERRAPLSAIQKEHGMHEIRFRLAGADGVEVGATLQDSEAARAFRALLPLTLSLTDYNGTEKISDLPARLPTEGAPAGIEPGPGDITYYAPWGNLAIFYKGFGYSRGLVPLGKLNHIPDAFRGQAWSALSSKPHRPLSEPSTRTNEVAGYQL